MAYASRGCLHYDLHDFAEALADYHKVIELDAANTSGDYARFRIWLIRARQQDAAAATVELQTFLASRTTGIPDDWVSKIGRFLAGQLSEPDFFAAAKNANPKTESQQLCEAYFYAGSKHLFAGDQPTATDFFQKSLSTSQTGYLEYASAAAELKFLKPEKN